MTALRAGRAVLLVLGLVAGCSRRSSLPTTQLQTPEQLAKTLDCVPQRDHGPAATFSSRLDDECDMKMDALVFLQAARTHGRLPDGALQRGLGVSFQAQGLLAEDIGTSVEFREFEVVNPLRGPNVLRARLSTGVEVAFCCEKVKARCGEAPCSCNSDCNGE